MARPEGSPIPPEALHLQQEIKDWVESPEGQTAIDNSRNAALRDIANLDKERTYQPEKRTQDEIETNQPLDAAVTVYKSK
jgi:hypothetical protein